MKALVFLSVWVLTLFSTALGAEVVSRSTLTEVTDYGSNPTGTRMFLYVPSNLATKPAIVVGIHWCSGSAQAYYQGTQWATFAETYGNIVIYPQTPYTSDNCWDVSSKMTLTHGGGGASNSIANMVDFIIEEYGADSSKVYVTGISSGAMMTVRRPHPRSSLFTDLNVERHGRYVSRHLRSWYRLRWCPCWLLYECRRRGRLLELHVLGRPVRVDPTAVGERGYQHVSGIHRLEAQDADIPWDGRPDPQRAELL